MNEQKLTPADHANTIRYVLGGDGSTDDALAAVDALQAQAETVGIAMVNDPDAAYAHMLKAEAERDQLTEQLSSARERWAHYYEALKAAEAERDAYAKQSEEQAVETGKWRQRAEAAEAERDRLQEEVAYLANWQQNFITERDRLQAGRDADRRILEGFREAAEAERYRLADALREIDELQWTSLNVNEAMVYVQQIARAALAGEEAYCTCPEGADGNPCAKCGKPEAVRAALAGEDAQGEYHAEGLDERGIYGGKAHTEQP